MAPATLYDLLGIDKSASAEEVRKAYKQKALVTHPDKFLEPGASEEEIQDASDRFHQIRQAFDILNDPRKRKSYDIRLNVLKPDYNHSAKDADLKERQMKMHRDREEWSRQVDRQRQDRLETIREQSRLTRQRLLQKEKDAAEHQSMVEEMLQEFHRLNPEWEIRRQNMLRLKEERARVLAPHAN